MVILLGYRMPSLPLTSPAGLVTPLLALIVTVGLHLWRRNAMLSILGGTTVTVLSTPLPH